MCGIIGGNKKEFKNYSKYFETLEHRGVHSFGLVGFKGNEVTWRKVMEITKKTKKFLKPIGRYDYWLGHNRWASIGGVNIDLAHPIEIGNILVVHNGTKKPLKEVFSKDVESDTQGIATLIKECFDNINFLSNILEGAGVVFGIDQNTGQIFFHRDETRPLMINKDRTLIASEPIEGGEWALIKEQNKLYNSFEEFLQNVEVYDWVEVNEDDLFQPIKCDKCGRTHYTKDYYYCFACHSKYDLTKPSYTQSTISNDVDWFKGQMVISIGTPDRFDEFDIGYIKKIGEHTVTYSSLLYDTKFTENKNYFNIFFKPLEIKHISKNKKIFYITKEDRILDGITTNNKIYSEDAKLTVSNKDIKGILYTKDIYEKLDWDEIF